MAHARRVPSPGLKPVLTCASTPRKCGRKCGIFPSFKDHFLSPLAPFNVTIRNLFTTKHIARPFLRGKFTCWLCGTQNEDLLVAFYSFVMADALLAGNSGLSYAASWLSKGWVWAFHFGKSDEAYSASEWTRIEWNEKGEVHIPKIQAPRWPRKPPTSPRPHKRLTSEADDTPWPRGDSIDQTTPSHAKVRFCRYRFSLPADLGDKVMRGAAG